MSEKKMGRPPVENPLSERIYLRVDKETKEVLDECVEKLNTTRSEVVRKGIYLVQDGLKKYEGSGPLPNIEKTASNTTSARRQKKA